MQASVAEYRIGYISGETIRKKTAVVELNETVSWKRLQEEYVGEL